MDHGRVRAGERSPVSTTQDELVEYRVEGWSMWPTLREGGKILVRLAEGCLRCGEAWPPAEGDLVLARHPFRRDQMIVKRVAGVLEGHRFDLRGDWAPESEDSGALGSFGLGDLVGRVVEEGRFDLVAGAC